MYVMDSRFVLNSAVTDFYDLNSTLNSTEAAYEGTDPEEIIFLVYYYGSILFLTTLNLIGNSMVILSMFRHRNLRVPSNYFIFSLAWSDLLLGITYPIYNVAHLEHPTITEVFGKFLA